MTGLRRLAPLLALGALSPLVALGQAAASSGVLTLPEAVATALRNNPAIKASADYSRATRQAITSARSRRYPKVDFSEGFTRGNNPVYVFGALLTQRQFTSADFALNALNRPQPLDNFQTQLTGSMPVYSAGQTSGAIRDATLKTTVANSRQERTKQEVVFQVVQAYTAELLAREGVRVAQSAVDADEASLSNAQARQQQGMAVPSDLLSAQVQLASAREGLLSANNAVQVAHAALNVAMGLPPDAPTRIKGRLSAVSFHTESLQELERQALANRPDYRAADLERQRAKNGSHMARTDLLPRLSLSGTWEADNQTFAAHGGQNWIAGARLTFNLFDGGAKLAHIREARALEQRVTALEDQFRSSVGLEVREAYLNLATAKERMAVAHGAVAQARESLGILENRYRSGLSTMTSVLQAETAHTQAEKNYLSAIYDYRLSFAALELATGKLSPSSPAVVQ